ncbi:MAG: hypothetical protein RLZZ45_1096, partial [Bacteroidota bacterium]
ISPWKKTAEKSDQGYCEIPTRRKFFEEGQENSKEIVANKLYALQYPIQSSDHKEQTEKGM